MYELKFLGRALQDLKKIDFPHQKIIKEMLLILAENPDIVKDNIKKLAGTKEDYYRLRVGNYRIIYEKRDTDLIILVIRIGHELKKHIVYLLRMNECKFIIPEWPGYLSPWRVNEGVILRLFSLSSSPQDHRG